jgi:hypothetical protein
LPHQGDRLEPHPARGVHRRAYRLGASGGQPENDIPGLTDRPELGEPVSLKRQRGERPLPHDDRVHELHRNVDRVAPLRTLTQHKQAMPRVEGASQVSAGEGDACRVRLEKVSGDLRTGTEPRSGNFTEWMGRPGNHAQLISLRSNSSISCS